MLYTYFEKVSPAIENKYDDFYDFSDFIQSLINAVNICIDEIEKGIYNQRIQKELPYSHRTGTISRKQFWDIFPDKKATYFNQISDDEVADFLSIMNNHHLESAPSKRIQNMTAEHFFHCCSLGYHANNYRDLSEKTWKEQYIRHADGRCEGLIDIDEKSPEAFSDWYHNRKYGGHPWEVCRGGNSTHISLYVAEDELGYYYVLAGSSYGRSIETIKFFLALNKESIPVVLQDGKQLAMRLAETDKIGIVPRSIMPWYCNHYFPSEKILDFINLPYKSEDKVISNTEWKPVETFSLDRKK